MANIVTVPSQWLLDAEFKQVETSEELNEIILRNCTFKVCSMVNSRDEIQPQIFHNKLGKYVHSSFDSKTSYTRYSMLKDRKDNKCILLKQTDSYSPNFMVDIQPLRLIKMTDEEATLELIPYIHVYAKLKDFASVFKEVYLL